MTNCNLSRIAMTEEGKDELKATNMGNCDKELPKKPVGQLLAVCWPSISQQIFWVPNMKRNWPIFLAPLN